MTVTDAHQPYGEPAALGEPAAGLPPVSSDDVALAAPDATPDDVAITAPADTTPAAAAAPADGVPTTSPARLLDRSLLGRLGMLAAACLVVLLAAEAVVFYGVGSLLAVRSQRVLMATVRQQIQDASVARDGLYRKTPSTIPPAPGTPVGILVIPALGLQQAVVEGVGSSQTAEGPGHVPGTAGLGQPGNAAVVARSSGYGAEFGRLADLRPGDHIVTATTQGDSLYVVSSIRIGDVVTHPPVTKVVSGPQRASGAATSKTAHSTSTHPEQRAKTTFNLETLYGATSDNRLTLVTSGSGAPWNSTEAVVVVAKMRGAPYAPTPQESRSLAEQGTAGDSDALPWLLLCLLALAVAVAGSAALYRRHAIRSAYLLTTAPLLALAIITALVASRLLPAWS